MNNNRLSAYRIMWIFILFDLPTYSPKQRKEATTFRKELVKDGFTMMQYSCYTRSCPSSDAAQVHIRRVKAIAPEEGSIIIMRVTDRQFADMEHIICTGKTPPGATYQYLDLFDDDDDDQ